MLRTCLSIILLSSSAFMANTIIYTEDFSQFTPTPTKGIREVVEIKDHPNVHKALLLKTTEGGNKATPSWTSPNFGDKIIAANQETVVVDYWLNPVTPSARYMLFVRDTRGTQMACALFSAAPAPAGWFCSFRMRFFQYAPDIISLKVSARPDTAFGCIGREPRSGCRSAGSRLYRPRSDGNEARWPPAAAGFR